MKQRLAAIVRRMGLLFFLDHMRYGMAYARNHKKNKAYLSLHKDQAFPPPYTIYETFRMDYQRYYEAGRADAEWVRDTLSRHKELVNSNILDWGCGPGRVVRHLPEVIGNGCNYFGTDYNRGYVDWCTKNLPGIQFKGNDLTPPLAFGSNTFDALYGISIFTHLSEEMHRAWFAELMRVLRPGGLAMLTTHGDATRVNLTPEEQTQYDRNELVVRGHVKEGHRMYAAYQPPAFMRQLATGQEALVLEHIPGKREHWGIGQDVWVFQKKG